MSGAVPGAASEDLSPLRIMSLHALAYCERLFFLEEVEEIRVADQRVYAGRTLHTADLPEDGSDLINVTLESAVWGLKGKVDYLRYRDGLLVPFEHKRGRSRGNGAWDSDRLQVVAYAALCSSSTWAGRSPRGVFVTTPTTKRFEWALTRWH